MDESWKAYLKSVAGQPYRPSNGTEGEIFQESWCYRCKRDQAFQEDPDNNDGCPILGDTMMYDVKDPKYPKEWVRDAEGHPKCTAFEDRREPERCPHTQDMFAA
jgi:hypothetical protein